jgi:hypothetical protein
MVSSLTATTHQKDSSVSLNVKTEMPMRLIDNIKDFSLDLADYVKNVELEKLAAAKMIDLAAEEMEGSRRIIGELRIDLEELHKLWAETITELVDSEKENASLHESLKLIETTHGIDLDNNMCELAERFRVVLFDVVREYIELEKANDTRAKD